MGKLLGQIKSVSDFLNDGLKAFKPMEGGELFKALVDASPWWLDALGETAKESFPLIGFVVKYADKLTQDPGQKEPQHQGYTACTLAYSRAVEQAFLAKAQIIEPLLGGSVVDPAIELPAMPAEMDMQGFALDKALSHEFVNTADQVFQNFAKSVGLTDQRIVNQLLRVVHQRFTANLRLLLVHPDTAPSFSAFQALIQSDPQDYLTRKAIDEHLNYQWWLFNEARLFRQEPFSLAHIYLDMDCGDLRWGKIRPGKTGGAGLGAPSDLSSPLDPFSETDSLRVDLLERVLTYIGDPELKEPIIVQGVAGVGKSTFTLRLMTELIERGLSPLRICLKHLAVDRPILEAIPLALRFNEPSYQPFPSVRRQLHRPL